MTGVDIFEEAKSLEAEGRDFYLKCASESAMPELSGAFRMLADEEKRHFELLNSLQNREVTSSGLTGTDMPASIGASFEHLASCADRPETIEDAEHVYQKALEIENKTVDFYREMLGKIDDGDQKAVIQYIIEQEKSHVRIMTGLIEFVRRPKEWLENAEWHHFEEY